MSKSSYVWFHFDRNRLNTTPEELQARFSAALRVIPARVRSW
ncbi:MAG TPA: hypothetical protein VGG75_01365 [Trebonia sp.]